MKFGLALLAASQALAAPAPAPAAEAKVGSWIVALKESAADGWLENPLVRGTNPFFTYRLGRFRAFAASLNARQLQELKDNDQVAYVEEDGILTTQEISRRSPDEEEEDDYGQIQTTQNNAPWGLARLSSRTKGTTSYTYDASGGTGTCSYVIDTGIYTAHRDFGGRASLVKNFVTSENNNDLNGHGTHVAGTIGGATYGVAKKTRLFALKVCSARGSCQLSAVNAAIQEAVSHSRTQSCPNGVIINMSLGAPNSAWQSLRDTVQQAVDAGIFVAVAAGNDGADASAYSPASHPAVCAAGASDINDARADFSNYGRPVKVFAPGVNILSAGTSGTSSTMTMSGTSMASPHLAGLGAYLQGLSGKKSPAALCSQIQSLSTKNVVSDVPSGTVNYLAYNGV